MMQEHNRAICGKNFKCVPFHLPEQLLDNLNHMLNIKEVPDFMKISLSRMKNSCLRNNLIISYANDDLQTDSTFIFYVFQFQ